MDLVALYRSVISAAGLTADDEGYVSVNNKLFTGEENVPAMIGDKRMVLPTDDHQKTPNKDLVIVHPLREHAMRGESEVFTKLKIALTTRLNFTMAAIVGTFIDIAKRMEIHKTLSPDQAQLLITGKAVTEKTHLLYTEIMLRTMSDPAMSFIHIFMKKSGTVDGVACRRMAVVNFPIYEELCKEQDKYFGIDIKQSERDNIKAMMEYLLPGLEVEGKYNRGSNSDVAPYMDALMASFGSIAANFNDKLELYGSFIPEKEALTINSDWVEVFENLDAYRAKIFLVPQQPGNEGAASVQPKNAPVMVQVPSATVQPQQTAHVAPQHHAQSQPITQMVPPTNRPKTFGEILQSNPNLRHLQTAGMYPPVQPSPGAPRGNWNAGPPQPQGGWQPNNPQWGGGYPLNGGSYLGYPRSIVW